MGQDLLHVEQGLSDTTVWVYISTPLGPGLAQITRQAAARSMKVCCFLNLHRTQYHFPQIFPLLMHLCNGVIALHKLELGS